MAIPDGTPAEEVQVENEEAKEGHNEPAKFDEHDPRKAIYEKANALRDAKETEGKDVEETAEEQEEGEGQADSESGEKPESEDASEGDKTFTLEEAIEQLGDIPVKVKIDGEEKTLPLSKIVRDGVKIPGLEAKLTRKAQEISSREKILTAAETRLAEQYEAAKGESKREEKTDPTALRNLTEDQVQEKYDDLVGESPYKAQKFLDAVKQDRQNAERQAQEVGILTATKEFLETYPDVTKEDWIYMNDRAFYEKYPDIVRSMSRAERTGDYYPTLVAARSRLIEERLSARKEDAGKREAERGEDAKRRIDAKKKGQVLRTQTKVETVIKKDEDQKPESRADYVRRIAQERRTAMGLGSLRK